MTTPNSHIAIVGAGIFGLTISLNLKQRGYKHVTVFDEQYHEEAGEYNVHGDRDVDAAYRYPRNKTAHETLNGSSLPLWKQWNTQIASTPAHLLPPGLNPSDRLFSPCGFLSISRGLTLSAKDRVTVDAHKAAGGRATIYVIRDPIDMARLRTSASLNPSSHWIQKAQLFDHPNPDPNHPLTNGFLNISSGSTNAPKTQLWLRHLCSQAGVNFISGGARGRVDEVLRWEGGKTKKVRAVKTGDGKVHDADFVILACGGCTSNLVPEVDELVERTMGSEVIIQLPTDRPDLWDKFSSERFYGSPRKEDGTITFGYRSGPKATKPPLSQSPLTTKSSFPIPLPLSSPTTLSNPIPTNSRPQTSCNPSKPLPTSLPIATLLIIRNAISQIFPELRGVDVNVVDTRMGSYTDLVRPGSSARGEAGGGKVADWAPGYDGLFVVFGQGEQGAGGFVPDLGKDLVDSLEKRANLFPWPSDALPIRTSTPLALPTPNPLPSPVSYSYPNTGYHDHQRHDSLTHDTLTGADPYAYSHGLPSFTGYPDHSTGVLSHHTLTDAHTAAEHEGVFPPFSPVSALRHSAEPPPPSYSHPAQGRRYNVGGGEHFNPSPSQQQAQQGYENFENFEALGGLEGLAMVAAGGELEREREREKREREKQERERDDWVWAKVEAAAGLASAKINGRVT
ncbi:hypothetical protein L202_03301 [Cryptococcus amylolentus CBS 6039]|uniref:FAD dependent oxidoreductase domain-containing protein n=2 Tax=Cryptococcus amylolentus TaxID=104669 RepID=A0A1E3HSF5_9TREE|nr:hypothetical protein L202_03301 [Cryptococcus amylolentus CBS 6039]ODN79289.1 hypothetical protein L202_03301 [Cryptococcus amylolentus CBS 6039]ODO07693.1 hypothetical protein I350_03265 [Cryptococcus amylolentus CBS 6273]